MNESLTLNTEAATDRAAKLAALRRTKFLATAALVACVALFLLARAFQSQVPALALVAAFFEAAAIGGIADWYAVVALFRRPLGLPIPHTAIIPRNQDRIADNLGRFIENNFLSSEPVRARLREIDFAALVADWLSDSRRAQGLSAYVAKMTPQMLGAVEGSGLSSFATQKVGEQLDRIRLAPLAAGLLSTLTEDGRHQRLLDHLLGMFGRFLADEQAQATLRDRIREELPTLANLFRADAYLLKKIVNSAGVLVEEVRADAEHPIRREFDRFVGDFVADLRDSPELADRAEKLKRDLLMRPEVSALGGELWTGLRAYIEAEASDPDSRLRARLADLFVSAGRQLAADAAVRADMNEGFVVAIASFVEARKGEVARFVSDQVKAWDLGQLVEVLEINVGRDLQYIRFNGMIVGGVAGLLLHVGERLLFH
ncbi:MAG: DUF445 family protein [Rhizobiaceae bacterium]|nr:DUF445 family protein [Rhizobiaceae bacterium]